ncbi:MAG: PAS domain S-box protein, partial [Deltaproteobacteria bacterium]|nr:PAS domain S-box protein [Deltaproteobacteria bacterium]MBW2026721.1 PAS domain S-box protein [Deltaproteobacteria bacterium]
MSRRDKRGSKCSEKGTSLIAVEKEVLAQIINFLPDATFAIDAEGRVTAWNRAMEELTGMKAEDIIGKGNYEYSIPLWGTRRPCLIDLVLHWDENFARSYEYIKRDGDTLFSETLNPPFKKPGSLFWNVARSLYDVKGNIVGAVEVIRDISERLKVEDAIRKSEAAYRTLFKYAGAATVIIEDDTTISKANPEFERLSGYSKEEIEGKMSWTQFVFPEDLERMKHYHYQRRKEPEAAPQQYEFRFVDRNGQVKYVLNRVTVIPGTKRSIASLLDITFRREAERALQESEQRYRSLFENTGAATFVVEEDLTISQVNARCEIFSGYSREELEGKMRITDFIAPEDLERIKTYHAARRIKENSVPNEYEFAWIDRHGKKKYGLIQIGIIPGTRKSIASFVDISDRKKMEEALRESEERYRLHFESVNDVIFSYGSDLKIIDISPSVERLLGYKPEELIGKSFHELNIVTPDYLEKAVQDAMKVFGGERIDSAEYAFVTKDGQVRFGEVSGHPIIRDGKIIGVVSVARDITKRKKAEEDKRRLEAQLIQAQKMEAVGTLAGGIAHDFNNLLQAILGYTQILLMGKDKDDPDVSNLRQIEMAAERARELTQQLLAFSRKVKSELRPVNLNQEVRQ